MRALVRDPGKTELPRAWRWWRATSEARDAGRRARLGEWRIPAAGLPRGGERDPKRRRGADRAALRRVGANPDTGNAITRYMVDPSTTCGTAASTGPSCGPRHSCPTRCAGFPSCRPATSCACPSPECAPPGGSRRHRRSGRGGPTRTARRKIHVPTGPESLLPEEQMAILARALGRDLRFEPQPDEEAREEMLKTTPPEYVDAFFDFYVAERSTSRRCSAPSRT